jgi:hypothetical protein
VRIAVLSWKGLERLLNMCIRLMECGEGRLLQNKKEVANQTSIPEARVAYLAQ